MGPPISLFVTNLFMEEFEIKAINSGSQSNQAVAKVYE